MKIPRCHFCGRLAPEFQYKNIAVCDRCLAGDQQVWCLYEIVAGEFILTPQDNPADLSDWTLVETGTFNDLWKKVLGMQNE